MLELMLDIVDVAGDGLAGLKRRSAEAGVQLDVQDPHGPGGGNPVCRLVGSEVGLQAWLLREYVPGEPDEARALVAGATQR